MSYFYCYCFFLLVNQEKELSQPQKIELSFTCNQSEWSISFVFFNSLKCDHWYYSRRLGSKGWRSEEDNLVWGAAVEALPARLEFPLPHRATLCRVAALVPWGLQHCTEQRSIILGINKNPTKASPCFSLKSNVLVCLQLNKVRLLNFLVFCLPVRHTQAWV